MIGRALDSNNDLMILNGQWRISKNAAYTIQSLKCRLQFFSNEWFLDLTAGLPYFESVFTKPINLDALEDIYKREILQTPTLASLETFESNYNSATRALIISFSATTDYNEIINDEVTVNV